MEDNQQKGLIVLDLDETLLTRLEAWRATYLPNPYENNDVAPCEIIQDGPYLIYLRPYIGLFFHFLFERPELDIAIWSAGTKAWVDYCFNHEQIFQDFRSKFTFIWNRNDCVVDPETNIYYKPMDKVRECFPNYDFYLRIDDFDPNPHGLGPNDLILIPPFAFFTDMENDQELLLLTYILKATLDNYPNVGDEFSEIAIDLYRRFSEGA